MVKPSPFHGGDYEFESRLQYKVNSQIKSYFDKLAHLVEHKIWVLKVMSSTLIFINICYLFIPFFDFFKLMYESHISIIL